MIIETLKIICSSFFAIGAFFTLLELKSKFDRSFLYFGLSIILLCFICAFDLWIIPSNHSADNVVFWTKVQHALSSPFLLSTVFYLSFLADFHSRKIYYTAQTACTIWFLFSISPYSLVVENGQAVVTHLYLYILFATLGVWLYLVVFITIKGLQNSNSPQNKQA
jgi:hypothetical protein